MKPKAYSYIRFSSPQQAAGDSLRRQTEETEAWCRRNNVELDRTLRLEDKGISAFKGLNHGRKKRGEGPEKQTNRDVRGLQRFLEAVKSGQVPPDSYLILENLDRLTRESIVPAINLFTGILLEGVRIVQLRPVEHVFTDGADMTAIMFALVELSRGNSESAMKSTRVGAAWARKRKEAGSRVVTRRLPGWIRYEDGKLNLIPERAKTVRRVFALARDGYGVQAIAKKLNADFTPVMGRKQFRGRPVRWNDTVVYHVLKSRAVIGEFQSCKGRGAERVPVGEPIPNYFPAVIDRDTYHAVHAGLKQRKRKSGRRGTHINLFAGLLKDWTGSNSLTYKHLRTRSSAIIPVSAKQGRGTDWSSFPAVPFDHAILSQLAEVKVEDVQDDNSATRKVVSLTEQKAEIQSLITAWEAKMDDPSIVDSVASKLAELKGKLQIVSNELADAQREESNRSSDAWKEFHSLSDMMAADNSDDLRIRVRSTLRRAIESMSCLFFHPVGRERFAFVRVQFRNGKVRAYTLLVQPPTSNGHGRTPGRWWAQSFSAMGFDLKGPITKPGFVVPESFANRLRAYATSAGCTKGEIP